MGRMKTNHWQIAWKRKSEGSYHLIENPKWGWCADPFLVEYEDELYLFAEIFLFKSERNGVIAYCKFDGNGWEDWVVTMDKPWHLSYPNVWVENGKLFMCPESYQLEEVSVYELLALPNVWKKIKTIISNVTYCDTTFLDTEDEGKYMFTFERDNTKKTSGKGIVYEIIDGSLGRKQIFSEDLMGNRCGGNLIRNGERWIRVAQNSEKGYGCELVFYEIDGLFPIYKEHEVKRIRPQDIKVEGRNNYIGIHTYNTLGDIEVIDLKYSCFFVEEYIARKRVRRVFVDKYL